MTSAFDEDALRHWLVDYLVTNIGCSPDEIDLDAPLNDLAVGSSDAVVLTGELSELLGRTVSPVEFWQYPTINALAKFLTGGEVDPVEGPAVAAAREGGRVDDDDAIAVIGLGLRLPGGSDLDGNIEGPEQFWEFLHEGRSAVREVPADRWESFRIESPEAAAALAGTTRWGSFLRDVDAFDAEFFEISPSEADKMDPQQRLLLEVTHEALEHAGIPAHSLRHTQTGVFAAACLGEYGYLSTTDLGDVDSWSGTGGALSIIANRVSYYFDFRGPSMTIDTACSSSLVTIHLACQSLRAGDSDLALASGVNMVLSPAVTRSFDQLEAMSKTGQCHAFDAAADGFVRGEGCGVAVLKRLSDAQRDGDRVLAVIRGSAVNQDGRSNGLMAPNPAAQMAVLRSAYAAAGVEPREVDYVEAHGTGTLLGDPIEARALGSVLGKGRPVDRPLLLGAVKSNLGHLEAAAGIAGFAKAVLALQHDTIPANRGYRNPNPHIPFDNLRLQVVAEHTDWTPGSRPRRAGISSFGFGGTNAHVVIEEAPRQAQASPADEPAVTTLVVTGRTPDRIAAQAGMLAEWMAGAGAEAPLADVAHALNHHRSQHTKFATVAARTRADAITGLQALAAGQSAPGVVGPHTGACTPGTVFVYSGQGSQWAGMGRQLLADEPAFAAAVAEIEPVFVDKVGFSLQEIIAEGRAVSGDAQVQPVLMGLQLALTELWRSYGVHPDAVIGHSMGEVTAAVVAGALSLADGLTVIAARSSIMSRLAGQGAVALVELDPDAAEALVADHPSVEIAGLVSPRQTVVAGLPDEVDAVIAAVTAQDRFARRVNMEVASHTALMDPVLPDLRDAFAGITPRSPSIPFVSTVVDDQDPVLDADYWVANVRRPVQLSRAVTAAGEEIGTFVEISANPILTYAVADTLTTGHHHVLGTLVRDGDDTVAFHTALNATHTTKPPQTEHPAHAGGARVALPTTPWHRTRHWALRTPSASGATAPRPGTVLGGHTALAGPRPGHLWQARLTPQARPYPHPHRFNGVEIVPLSVLLHTLALAAEQVSATALVDVRFKSPIALDAARTVQVYADADVVTISSAAGDAKDGPWVRHVSARISREPVGPAEAAASDVAGYDPAALTELHHAWGVDGLAYPWTVDGSAQTRGESRIEVTFADAPEARLAAALDAAVNLGRLVDASTPGLLVPATIERFAIITPVDASAAARGTVVTRHLVSDAQALLVDLSVDTADGAPVADLRGVRYVAVDTDDATSAAEPRRIAHRLDWQPWSTDAAGTDAGPVAVVGTGPVASALRQAVGSETEVAQARTVVYVAASDGPSAQEVAVRLTTEVGALVATLADREPRHPATLWIVTQGVSESATDAALRQSPLWGLAGVIGAEQPQLWGGLVDVPETETDLGALVPVLASPVKSVAVWRAGELLTPTLAEITDAPSRELLHCRPDAAYLITGGMGVLGLLMAEWLADRGARRIVLAGRTALPPRRAWDAVTDTDERHKIDAIRALELRGVSVDTVAVDIADRDAVAAMLERRDAGGAPPIRGVIHAAGMTEAQLLTELEAERVHRTVWPKIAGAQVLAEVFPPHTLDFLYLAASAGAVFGIPGQGAYAAGNAYLDALARARHAQGDNTVSLDWVAWRGLGFGSEAQVVVSELERVGSRPVAPGEAFAAWDHVTRFDIGQVVMAPMNSAQDAAAVADAHRPAAPVRNWAAMDRDELLAELRDGLRGILATELRLPESDVLTDRPFAEMGLNSVMAMSIRREIERLAGLELSATMLFNHPTIDSFAGYLAQQLNPDAGGDDAAADDDDDEDSLLDSLFDSVESN
ncbi:acyltransferase domain-containing protein [Mycolicibacterium sp. 018/SC-01/001]|uniref:type I polyketide synthase n=1 Tax=Mycolicibacterium sp. 018/SC-01/001 TaxID=2592069 RepID=UPI00117CF2AE|nr:type I polyketide synthase [Mycolicibacterium sp. 018/SC-01/001]TRW82359.1 acyltransferase domain-containing protein [Mycolicibacterium sp. 018/SC-01/001]